MPWTVTINPTIAGDEITADVEIDDDGFSIDGPVVKDSEDRLFFVFLKSDPRALRGVVKNVGLGSFATSGGPIHNITVMALVGRDLKAYDRRQVQNGKA